MKMKIDIINMNMNMNMIMGIKKDTDTNMDTDMIRPDAVVLSQLSCDNFPVQLSCSSCPALAVIFWLTCPFCPVQADQFVRTDKADLLFPITTEGGPLK
jgi:hypothetical protein